MRFFRRAGLEPKDIDLIVAGAAGSPAGDRLEALTLKRAWAGAPLPPVLAPRSVTGSYGGPFLAAAILAAAGQRVGRTAGFAEPDPELDLVPHDGSALVPPNRVLVSCLASGGAASWLVLERA